jgi:hypothetical protein
MLEITYKIKCDGCGITGKKETGKTKQIPKAHLLRDFLVSNGWFNNYGPVDLCPKCKGKRRI